ncbi:MAG: hypothetical protein QM638_22470 [Nocardioides sp.]|uniref:DUF7507 domain-containing protein n=1 Tax=Nocardioides sp. TaxID=35761 RepID=UPI0039E66C25
MALGLLAVMTPVVIAGIAGPADAVPAGSEYPDSWSVTGTTATGTTASGVEVTATVSGSVSLIGTGGMVFGGARPSYLPSSTTAALIFGIQNCTNTAVAGCGSVTYTFSQPVRVPVVYVGDVGADTGNQTIVSYHDHPMTVRDGTLSLDSTGSQTSRMQLKNGNQTVGIDNPRSYVGTGTGGATSCGVFGCGAYDVTTDTTTVTSLTFDLSYDGTGTNADWWNQIVGITPATTSLSLTKTADPTTVQEAGDEVSYSFTLTNTGEVAVTDPEVSETDFSGSGGTPDVDCPAGTLEVGASVTCTASYTVTQTDVDSGEITNTATATATPPTGMTAPVSAAASATVTVDQAPALSLDKSVAETGDLVVGETLHYSFTVTNTGNVTIGDLAIDEQEFTGSGELSEVSCPDDADSLAPQDSVTCTATYTVTQADVDQGSVENTATVSGTPPGADAVTSDPSSARVPASVEPALTLVKSADSDSLNVGETITFTFLATNSGNVTLHDVGIDERSFSGSGTLDDVDCPDFSGSIAPGSSTTCTAAYTVTQADVDQGLLANTAVATGTPTGGSPVTSPPSTVTIHDEPTFGLELVKSSDTTRATRAGQSIRYDFEVTNTGSGSVTAPEVEEASFTGHGTVSSVACPATTRLLPGESMSCTATYTVRAADLTGHGLRNVAVAHASTPSGTVTSNHATKTIATDDRQVSAPSGNSSGHHPTLPDAGSPVGRGVVAAGLLLIAAGGALLLLRPRRHQVR